MQSGLWEEFFAVYEEIQQKYEEFIRDVPKPRMKLLNLEYGIPNNKKYTEIFSFYAADMLIANCFSSKSQFFIRDLVDCSDNFVQMFDIYTARLQIHMENFLFSLNANHSDPNAITPNIFHLLGERIVRNETPDSGIVFTPSEVVHLLTIQSIMLYLRNNTKLDAKTILEILTQVNSSSIKIMHEEDMKSLYTLINKIRILDPACGTGLFCFEITEMLFQMQSIFNPSFKKRTRAEIFQDNVFGIDVNPRIIFKLYFLIRLWLIQHHEEPMDLDAIQTNFICDDSLLRDYKPEDQYDIILGNPPYVRQENIRALGITNLKNLGVLGKTYKEEILQKVSDTKCQIDKRSDLYIYFFYLAFKLSKQNGIVSFLTSNSWLNIGFGFNFQEWILKHTEICSIVDFDVRAFSEAEINTIITSLSNTLSSAQDQKMIHFARLTTSIDRNKIIDALFEMYENEKNGINMHIQESSEPNSPFLRFRSVSQKDLISGIRWGNEYLLAPRMYFDIKKHIGIKLFNLGKIATITRGITTGLNRFFILEKISEKDDLITVKNGYSHEFQIERECLRPFLISPKRQMKPFLMQDNFTHYILAIPEDKQEYTPKHAKQYIKYGESIEIEQTKGKNKGKVLIGAQNIPTLQGKKKYFTLTVPQSNKGAQVFIQKIFSSKFKVYFSQSNNTILANNTFYNINLKPEFEGFIYLIIASLLSSLTYLLIELNGRRSFGMGALDTASFDIENILVLNPLLIPESMRKEMQLCANSIANREFLEVADEFQKNDRRKLDFLVLEHLSMAKRQDELYDSIKYLVQQRISKSLTYKRKKESSSPFQE